MDDVIHAIGGFVFSKRGAFLDFSMSNVFNVQTLHHHVRFPFDRTGLNYLEDINV